MHYAAYWLDQHHYMLIWLHAGALHMMSYDSRDVAPGSMSGDIVWLAPSPHGVMTA